MTKRFPDYDLPKRKISLKRGLGIEFTDQHGNRWRTVAGYRHGIVRLRVTSFRGISFGARHWYGRLEIEGSDLLCLKSPLGDWEVGKQHCISGAIDKHKPRTAQGLYIEVKRFVTAKDMKDPAFKDYGVFKCAQTDRFDSIGAIYEEASRIFRLHFGKGWKLEEEE